MTDLLAAAYAPLLALSDSLATQPPDRADTTGWTATALPGWTVRDLVFHLAGDAQRALVALHTPTAAPPDTDAISYWSRWEAGSPGADTGQRVTRTMASQWSSVAGPAGLHRETARAVLHAVAAADPGTVVVTQGHTLTVASLVSTLAVEAAVHHLDLVAVLPDPPAPEVLAEVRRVCDALLGRPTPPDWSSERWARLATGRADPTSAETAALGDAVARLPLFG
ncbi:maleylpyruvate isomerase N-terminal domain-containing protein [Jatrophihabitans sp. YIM 134969]